MQATPKILPPWRIHAVLLLALLAGACGTAPTQRADHRSDRDGHPSRPPRDLAAIPDAVPKVEPRSRYGNPTSYVVFGKRYQVMPTSAGYVERGVASWYGTKFHGARTSSGEAYDMYAMTAAHKSLPLPTYARVINLANGRSVVVKINDRGPFVSNRIIDLSYTAAAKLGIIAAGTGLVEVRALDPRQPEPGPRLIEAQRTPTAPTAPATTPAALDSVPIVAASAGATPSGPAMYLQVGAFVNRDNAEQLRAKLSQVPIADIQVSEGLSNQRPVYRVRIGPLASVDEADRVSATLGRYGIDNPQVVTD